MKFSKLETVTISLTLLTLAFLSGWFFSGQAERWQVFTPTSPPAEQTVSAAPSPAPTQRDKVHLNRATAAELMTLPGIGEKRAADIVAYRDAHGPFPVVESLTDVPGIGESLLAQCMDYITVED